MKNYIWSENRVKYDIKSQNIDKNVKCTYVINRLLTLCKKRSFDYLFCKNMLNLHFYFATRMIIWIIVRYREDRLLSALRKKSVLYMQVINTVVEGSFECCIFLLKFPNMCNITCDHNFWQSCICSLALYIRNFSFYLISNFWLLGSLNFFVILPPYSLKCPIVRRC